ncbi:IS3 family transposase [Companilactobacillus nodensis]|uniref:IS3 family transposase n=1 Tax=Companilactobacillus nodensis TaxID=460870 RepID=UPI002286D5FB|nr:IS3 family transposase [Companilactobacillus nodensis]
MIKELANKYPVAWICQTLEITRRSYYKWLSRKNTDNDMVNDELIKFIKKLESEHNNIFGVETLVMYINSETKYHVNAKRVRRLMKLYGIKSSIRVSKHDRKAERKEMMSSNILKHNFTQDKSNAVWSTDCTELKYGNQDSYKIRLSAIKDLYDHSIIAWAIADTETKDLVTDTIKIAVTESGVDVHGLILHTDQGSAYTSLDFNKQLDGYGIRHSMSRPGTPGDNAPMESFWSHLKDEYFDFNPSLTKEELINNITKAIDWYNNGRRQKTLKGMTPTECRNHASQLLAS